MPGSPVSAEAGHQFPGSLSPLTDEGSMRIENLGKSAAARALALPVHQIVYDPSAISVPGNWFHFPRLAQRSDGAGFHRMSEFHHSDYVPGHQVRSAQPGMSLPQDP